ncbi:beta-N-acetylhexosaminidase [Thalassospira sp. TSL5-1]|uniref:beta-N-acetylhexosaminidase n=1 Tax=Thalassospira sp. TSL5-1 TaxID=1544451 RepID=UPI00095DE920|nr:beta-N-acetylhexosaminidase [Thalassospira sp. TSL5-1]OKH89865.1 beta-hexosaminidase [Thalassospira sp. TSL5-1]
MSGLELKRPKACILGLEGTALSNWEKGFFREADPYGFILFARNVVDPDQLKRLTMELRDMTGRSNLPILVDQEGGRVARLKPPHWRKMPAAGVFGQLYEQRPEDAREAAYLNARLLAADLVDVGISVVCAPVLDLYFPGMSDVVGDRSYGSEVANVVALASAVSAGLLDGGIIPVIKHIPGHGRAAVDSHKDLPVVTASKSSLSVNDFEPFRQMKDILAGMSAHILFTAIDDQRPATVSPTVIRDVIRGDIGFENLLISDDLSMEALGGSIASRTHECLAAGCDIALHCNGKRTELEQIVSMSPALDGVALERALAVTNRISSLKGDVPARPVLADWNARLAQLLAPVWAPAQGEGA